MSTNDLDSEVMNQSTDFIVGTSLAGWIAGLALCTYFLTLATAQPSIIKVFALGTLIFTIILGAWIARRPRG